MSNRTPVPTNVSLSRSKADVAVASANPTKVLANNHVVTIDADYGIWDSTSNVFVLPEETNFKRQ